MLLQGKALLPPSRNYVPTAAGNARPCLSLSNSNGSKYSTKFQSPALLQAPGRALRPQHREVMGVRLSPVRAVEEAERTATPAVQDFRGSHWAVHKMVG